MSLSIDIVPLADSLDMYGEPRSSSAYSLSGHVSIALSSPYSVFERRRPARILLQSVLLTFDGQTEVVTEKLGYSGIRLCSYSKSVELGPRTIELTNEGQEDTDEPCRWNIVFDLPIPGWLPASHDFAAGDIGASTQYFLHAVVQFLVLDDQRANPWSFSTLCSPFRSRARSIQTCKTITLRRFIEPPTDEPAPVGLVNYLLTGPSTEGAQIPADVVSKIQVLASVPKHVDVCDNVLPLTLRLRTKDLEDDHCKRLQLKQFAVEIFQEETFRRVTDVSVYQTQYPLPSADCQPPNKPLLHATIWNLGLFLNPSPNTTSTTCSGSLLPGGDSGIYYLTGDRHIFAEDAETASWYTLETSIPIVHDLKSSLEGVPGASKLCPSGKSPIYGVSHSLKLTVTCEYEMPSGELVGADLKFTIPLTFGRVAPPLPPRDILPALYTAMRLTDGSYPLMPELLPFCANLPAYSQLFDSQGNRKMDATPLPLYSPRSSSDSETPVDLLPTFNEKQDILDATTV
ncbi:hypothetical protein C8F04DRAFT_218500 [Mycena alexandri]|uniref:Uncharacterized protein n=1 Tax=Mycena alexandri TaxID=1745969 RepID=A0AAD6TK37_9AGAR|nr:hypothetical protein C8F04DRAFT_218500 [Mycena alexandri]